MSKKLIPPTLQLDTQFMESVGRHHRGNKVTMYCPECRVGFLHQSGQALRCDRCEEIITIEGVLVRGNKR